VRRPKSSAPSGTRRASPERLSRRLLAPPLRSVRRIATPPGAACGVRWPPRSGAPPTRADTSGVHYAPRVAAFPPVVSALFRPAGTPLRPAGSRTHLNRRTNRARRSAWGRGGGSARPLRYAPACGSGRCAPSGRVRMARRSRCPRARPRCAPAEKVRAVIQSRRRTPARTARPTAPARTGLRCPPCRPFRLGRRSCPRALNPCARRASLRVVRPLLALRLGGLRCAPKVAALRPRAAARWKLALRRA
jgi:hypothetical protein